MGYGHKPIDNCPPRLKAYESWVNFDCIFLFPLFRLVSGDLGENGFGHVGLEYIRFSQKLVGVLG